MIVVTPWLFHSNSCRRNASSSEWPLRGWCGTDTIRIRYAHSGAGLDADWAATRPPAATTHATTSKILNVDSSPDGHGYHKRTKSFFDDP
jgi:hypothetical protein